MGIHPFLLLTFCTLLSKYVFNILETNKTSPYEKSKYVFLCENCIEIRIIIKYISIFSPKGTKRYLNFTIEEGCHPNSPHVG